MYNTKDFVENKYFGITPQTKALDRVKTFDVAIRNAVTLGIDFKYMIKAKNFKEFLFHMQQTLNNINKVEALYDNPDLVRYVVKLPHNAPYLTRFQELLFDCENRYKAGAKKVTERDIKDFYDIYKEWMTRSKTGPGLVKCADL